MCLTKTNMVLTEILRSCMILPQTDTAPPGILVLLIPR